MRLRLLAGAIGTGAILASVLLAAPATAATGADAGYVATAGGYTSVTATWTVPTLTCTTSADLALWTGLDGEGSATVEQIGIDGTCADGSISYQGFYEMYPAAPVFLNGAVNAGDSVTGSVTRSGSTFTLTLLDNSAGWSRTVTKSSTATGASAEVFAECAAGSCPGHPVLAFTGARVNGAALGAAHPTAVSGVPGTPSALTASGTGFTIQPGTCTPVCPVRE